jgi:hypothetical protein
MCCVVGLIGSSTISYKLLFQWKGLDFSWAFELDFGCGFWILLIFLSLSTNLFIPHIYFLYYYLQQSLYLHKYES